MKEEKPESMEEIYSKETFTFLCQYKLRSHILRKLKEEFNVEELVVISEKKDK